MPTISRQQIGFEKTIFLRELKVSSEGIFSIELPPAVVASGTQSPVTGKSKDDAVRAFNAALTQYQDSKTTVRRVILFRFQSTCCIVRGEKCVKADKDIWFVNGTAISLCAQVYDEAETKRSNGSSHFRYTPIPSSIPDGFSFLKWINKN